MIARITLLFTMFSTFWLYGQTPDTAESVSLLKQALHACEEEDWATAHQHLVKLSPVFDQQNDRYHQALTETWLSETSYYLNDEISALQHAQKALMLIDDFSAPVKDTLSFYPLLLQNLGFFYSSSGDYELQRYYYLQLYKLAKQYPDPDQANIQLGLYSLSVAYANKMDWDSCIIVADAALKIALGNQDNEGIGEVYDILSSAYAEKGQINKAIDLQQEALNLVTDLRRKSNLYFNLGFAYFDIGNPQMGIDYLQQSLTTDSILSVENLSSIRTRLGLVRGWVDLGEFERAEAQLDMVLQKVKESADPDLIMIQRALNYKASIAYKKGNYHTAIRFSEASIAYQSKDRLMEASALLLSAKSHHKLGFYSEALRLVQQSLQKAIKGFKPKSLSQNPSLEKINYKLYILDLLSNKARIQHSLGMQKKENQYLEDAIQTYRLTDSLMTKVRSGVWDRESKEILSAQAKLTYEGALTTLYQLHSDQHGDDQWLDLAFSYSEKNRSMLIAENLNEMNARNFAQIPEKLINQERRLVQEIDFYASQLRNREDQTDPVKVGKWEKNLSDKRTELDKLLKLFEDNYPDYFALKYNLQTGNVANIRSQLLAKEEVLLEYFMGKEHTFLLIIGQNEKYFIQLPKSADALQKEVLALRDSLLTQSPDFYTMAHELYQDLLGDYEEAIAKKSLVIVPDGVLGYLPFEVLLIDEFEENPGGMQKAPYLIRHHQIRYVLSACVALQYQRKGDSGANGKILAMAPIFNREVKLLNATHAEDQDFYLNLAELRGSIKELEILESQFEGAYLLGAKANEAAFKQEGNKYSLIHISTHAFFNDQSPSLSYLVLSAEENGQQDGRLHAYEVYGMQLKANLVVLSACNTGFGVFKEGEGIASLARAFAFAGSPNLVMSLWSVDDFSTGQLMQIFYKNLGKGMTKAEALHQAKISYLDQPQNIHTHPFYWGGLIYTGDREPILLKHQAPISFYWIWGLLLLVVLLAYGLYRKGKPK